LNLIRSPPFPPLVRWALAGVTQRFVAPGYSTSPSARDINNSMFRHPVPSKLAAFSLLSLLLHLLVAIQIVRCDTLVAAGEGSLPSRSLLKESASPPLSSSAPSHRLAGEYRGLPSGGTKSAMATAVAEFVRASSSPISSEKALSPRPKSIRAGVKGVAARTGISSQRLSRRTLNQALDAYTGGAQIAKLIAADGAEGNYFGYSLAVDGDTMVIGAYGDGTNRGSAYIFTRDDAGSLTASWTQRAKLLASDGAAGDYFGRSVAISGDTVVMGAYGDDDKGSVSGSAYIFTRDDAGSLTASWTQRAKLLATNGAVWDRFGRSVAISGDIVVVGAYGGDDDKGSYSGSAYIFTRDDAGSLTASWTQRAKLLASDGATDDYFGVSVAISGDTVVVGASRHDDKGSASGSAYIFARDDAGSLTASWTQRAKLLASDGAANDYFGFSVAISGNTAVVGAYGDDDDKGSAYIFTTASVEFVAIEASMGGARTRMYNYMLMGCQQLIGIV